MLDDKVPEVRKEAATALGFFNEPEEVSRIEQPLIDLLGDDELEVQKAAAYSLGDIGSKKPYPLLQHSFRLKIRLYNLLLSMPWGDTKILRLLTLLLLSLRMRTGL